MYNLLHQLCFYAFIMFVMLWSQDKQSNEHIIIILIEFIEPVVVAKSAG